MSRLLLLLSIIPVFSEDIFGTFYSFDVDFYRSFDDKCCENKTSWYLVDYASLGILAPETNILYAIRASENSCTSSFPFILLPNSTLELLVYLSTVSEASGIVVSVMSEHDNTPLQTHFYNSTSDGFVSGWSRIKMAVKINKFGYVNIRGKSRGDELVLIDSIYFAPNVQKKEKENYDVEDEILFSVPRGANTLIYEEESFDESDKALKSYAGSFDYDFLREGSGDGEECPETEPREPILGLWTLILIGVGAVTLLALVGVAGYYIGKRAGRDHNPLIDVEIEPQSVVNIPRARPVSGLNVREYY